MLLDPKESLDFLAKVYNMVEEGKAVITSIDTEVDTHAIQAAGSTHKSYITGQRHITISIDC